ncbi:methylated-DNA--[protein]-cysteine S-methyltransferase [Rhodococcus sp. NPDC059969]|uniref:methylated-DNA--[protein]-cysteine S-methyltransferase n=1 Tax=Rhodococcus sp. NPDC059969 TaxID=3347018 RepID=UPI003670136E
MNTDAEVFEALPAVDADALTRLRARLATEASEAELIDVAYRTVDSPVGKLLLAATDVGLVRVAFAVEGHDRVLERLSDTVSPRVLHYPRRLDNVARELDEYFAGARREFDLNLDFQLAKGFRREVLRHLPEIEYGHTASYSVVAAASGSPRAVRAVGTACAKNPLPLVVPCHRVVRSDGSLGQYAGGPELKAILLKLESNR